MACDKVSSLRADGEGEGAVNGAGSVPADSMYFSVLLLPRAAFLPHVVHLVVVAFSSRARILGECSATHSPPALFFFFFFKVEISSRTLISSLGQDQSTVAQRADTAVTECSLTSCV